MINQPSLRLSLLLAAVLVTVVLCETHAAAPTGKTTEVDLGGNIKITLVRITAGKFTMGSPANEKGRRKDEEQKAVTIAKDFYMGESEVTQGQWKAIMGTTPWKGQQYVKEGDHFPATYISWHDAQAFMKKLSAKTGQTCRLPSEAEWEYACRAGTKTAYSFGNDDRNMADHEWYKDNCVGKNENYDHQVKTKKPNPWGLYDMHGNTSEWCSDFEVANAGNFSTNVVRGGAWYGESNTARSAFRNSLYSNSRFYGLGFRIVLEAGK